MAVFIYLFIYWHNYMKAARSTWLKTLGSQATAGCSSCWPVASIWLFTKNHDLEVLTGDTEKGRRGFWERLTLIFHKAARQQTIKISDISSRAWACLMPCRSNSSSLSHHSEQAATLLWGLYFPWILDLVGTGTALLWLFYGSVTALNKITTSLSMADLFLDEYLIRAEINTTIPCVMRI